MKSRKLKEMREKLRWVMFGALVGLFVAIATPLRELSIFNMKGGLMAFPGIALALLGVALIILTVKEKMRGMQKRFFLLTGASAVGMPASLLLHSVIYHFYPQEPFTYVMFFFVCPTAFLAGAVATIVLAIRGRK